MKETIHHIIFGGLILWGIIELAFYWRALIPLVLIFLYWVIWYNKLIINKD